LLVRNTQIAHASLVEKITTMNPAIQSQSLNTIYNLATPTGLESLNVEITRQASMIAYVDNFWLMLLLTLMVIPLLLLIHSPKKTASIMTDHAAME